MVLLFASYLFVVLALPLGLGIAISFRGLSRERQCPLCGSDTLRVRAAFDRVLEKIIFARSLQRRWCVTCGWLGAARVTTPLVPALAANALASNHPVRACRTEPVRILRFSGMQWRVLLQCWQENGLYCGQLLFIGPTGHLRRDPKHPFKGPSRAAIVEQALALSDGLLTYRLRELVSD